MRQNCSVCMTIAIAEREWWILAFLTGNNSKGIVVFSSILTTSLTLFLTTITFSPHTHTHTHTHIYIYIYIFFISNASFNFLLLPINVLFISSSFLYASVGNHLARAITVSSLRPAQQTKLKLNKYQQLCFWCYYTILIFFQCKLDCNLLYSILYSLASLTAVVR